MASFNYDGTTRTLTVIFTEVEATVYDDQFIGGVSEGVESLLSQNIRQRSKGIVDAVVASTLQNGGPLSFVDTDDLIGQHVAKPEYKNAAARHEEEQERIRAEQAAAAE